MVDINEYTRETTCEYKGEVYSVTPVRDKK